MSSVSRRARSLMLASVSAAAFTTTVGQLHAQTAQNLPTVRVEDLRDAPPNLRPGGAGVVASSPSTSLATPPTTITGDAISARAAGTSDSASLTNDIPGGATWGAGGVSSLPALNGQGADRVQVAINSMLISPACPNEMNPPLSFVNPAMIAKMQAYLGVAPVSAGGDYTGGKIIVEVAPPKFAPSGEGWVSSALLSGFYRSINNSYGVDASATLANKDTSITYTGGWVRAEDYRAADGTKVKSTLYEMQNHALSISKQSFGNLFTF
jgi:iron complex outermembrane receptor protein